MSLLDFIMPSTKECDSIEAEAQQTILGEVFGKSYFERVRQQINDLVQGKSSRLSSIYSILQRPEWRKKLVKFLQEVKRKSKPTNWRHLCKRLAMLDQNTDLEALFEVVVLGNLILQLPDDRIVLNAPTENKRNVDAKIRLMDRFVYLEITLLGSSVKTKERRERMERYGVKHAVWTGIGDGHSRRIEEKLQYKSSQFLPGMPNVLALCSLEVWDRMPGWEQAVEGFSKENIGHLYVFDRMRLGKTFIGDPACTLAEDEERKLQELLNGENYYAMGFI